ATTFAQETLQVSGRTMKALFATQFLTLLYCLVQSVLFIVDWSTRNYPSEQISEGFGIFVIRITAVVLMNISAQIALNPRILSDEKPVVVEEMTSRPTIGSVA
ncbi:MAG: hypothetical protein ACK41T_01885, partial [Pseudobdellovibrio sp.]